MGIKFYYLYPLLWCRFNALQQPYIRNYKNVTMKDINNQIVNIIKGKYSQQQLVTILEVIIDELNIDTVSQIARDESKSRNGIISSNNYLKIKIGKQLFAVVGVKENNLPF